MRSTTTSSSSYQCLTLLILSLCFLSIHAVHPQSTKHTHADPGDDLTSDLSAAVGAEHAEGTVALHLLAERCVVAWPSFRILLGLIAFTTLAVKNYRKKGF